MALSEVSNKSVRSTTLVYNRDYTGFGFLSRLRTLIARLSTPMNSATAINAGSAYRYTGRSEMIWELRTA